MNKSNIKFFNKNSLPVIELSNSAGSLEVSTYGAHVLSWKPAGGSDVLWMSPSSPWKEGAALRGGIPVCFPWFGPNRIHSDWQLHGFVRTRIWDIVEADCADDCTRLVLALDSEKIENKFGYGDFALKLEIILSKSLTMKFTVENRSCSDFTFENGLHTYFAGDPQSVCLQSLDGVKYYDKVDNFSEHVRKGQFCFDSNLEQAHFYMDAPARNVVDIAGRKLVIDHDGFSSAIIWSPGEKAGLANPEIKEGWKDFFCYESANAIDDRITIGPGSSHTSTVTVSLA